MRRIRMKLSSNIMRFYQKLGINETIDIFGEVGIEARDFNCDIEEFHNDTHDKEFYVELRKYAVSKGITFGQTHAPFASAYVDKNKAEKRFGEIVTSMKYSSYLGAPFMVVHPCQHFDYSQANKDAIYQYNLDFYRRLIPYYEKYGVKVAIENINSHDKFGFASAPEAIKMLHDELDNEAFSVCFDVGHVNMVGIDPADAIRVLGKRIGCLHVHDNDGVHDTHTLPYYGTINWDSVAKALADVHYQGTLNYEAAAFVSKIPEDIYRESAKYMSIVGHKIIEQIENYRK